MFDGCVVIIYYFVNYLCIEYVGYEVDCFMGSIIYYVYWYGVWLLFWFLFSLCIGCYWKGMIIDLMMDLIEVIYVDKCKFFIKCFDEMYLKC